MENTDLDLKNEVESGVVLNRIGVWEDIMISYNCKQ